MEISSTVEEINLLIAELCKYNKETDKERLKIQFPKGVITSVEQYKRHIPFITKDILQRNIAYHLMLDDVFIWLLQHFAFYAVVKDMIVKIAIANLGNIMEAITQHLADNIERKQVKKPLSGRIVILLRQFCFSRKTKQKKVKIGIHKGLNKLVKTGIITKKLKKNILWVWGIRCKQHLESLKRREYNAYNTDDYRKAIGIWREFNNQLFISRENEVIEGSENIIRGF